MSGQLEETISILERLVGFQTVSGTSTKGILGYISDYLSSHGIESSLSFDPDGERANLYATIGPQVDGGLVLSGHTDVVPVEGQTWATDPFTLTRKNGCLYGRGAVDMKGFLACALAAVPAIKQQNLKRPVHLAFSYDEETGGIGMPRLLDDMATKPCRPDIVIVGEPTRMKIIAGHKGGFEMHTDITGLEAHSSKPANGLNAISYAAALISKIDEIGARFAANPYIGSPYEPPHATFNVGIIRGGAVRNATAGSCHFEWEMRPMPGEDGRIAIAEIEDYAKNVLEKRMHESHAEGRIDIVTEVDVPPLDDSKAGPAIAFVCEVTGQNSTDVVSFGTDAGYFSNQDYSTVVFGPGDIDRAHKPDEFIREDELVEGVNFIVRAAGRLAN